MDPAYALRTANKKHRTTPLRALWQRQPYFRDSSAATLAAVVDHYERCADAPPFGRPRAV
jgi:cytochrome c peroxidase